jgi:uncharacterized protein YegP (UPF0339 family)
LDAWEFYEDTSGHWRWKHTAADGRVIATAIDGHETKAACLADARRYGYKG